MKKIITFICMLFTIQVWADDSCFLMKENGKILQSQGDIAKRYSPCSTFKIALSLMGYDAGILQDQTHPTWAI